MKRSLLTVAAVALPFALMTVALTEPIDPPARRPARSGDRYVPAATSSIGPDPTAPILLFVPSDIDAVTIKGMPYARPQWEIVALFVDDARPKGLAVTYGALGCLCYTMGQHVDLRITDAGAWAIVPVRRVGREPDHPQVFQIPRRFGVLGDDLVPPVDITTLPRMRLCEGIGGCE